MELICIFIAAASLMYAVFTKMKTAGTIGRLDAMTESAVNRTLKETEFDESRLSRLESRLYRFLKENTLSEQTMANDREKIKSLIGDISHQTKTPVANITLYSELLCEREDMSRDAHLLAEQVRSQSEKLTFLINSLVKTSRLESGIITLSPERNNLKELAETAAETCGAAAEEKGTELICCADADVYAVFDMKWTAEAVLNIVDNAVKYTPPGGTIVISYMEYESFSAISVTDNGEGINEEESAKIFGRFFRGRRHSDIPGAGIGLYIARDIVSREGGYIRLRSKPGEGSEFTVFLPKR